MRRRSRSAAARSTNSKKPSADESFACVACGCGLEPATTFAFKSESANRIDQELQQDADKKGTPFGPFMALFDDPLSVLYTVDPGDCMVRVIQVLYG